MTRTRDHQVNEAEIVQETEPATPPLTSQPAPKKRRFTVPKVKFPRTQAPARQVLRELAVQSSNHEEHPEEQSPPQDPQMEPDWGCPRT